LRARRARHATRITARAHGRLRADLEKRFPFVPKGGVHMRPGRCRSWRRLSLAASITAALGSTAFAQSPILIVAPASSEFVDARFPFTVRWEAPDIPGNAGFFVYYVHASVRHAICDAAPAQRECVWADPPAPAEFSGTLFVEARAADGTVLAAAESEPFILHEGFLPNPWVGSIDVGDVGVPGSSERSPDDSTIVLRGSGSGIGGTADAFHLLYTAIVGGDAVNMRVTITDIDGPPGTQVALTVRNTSDPGSVHESLVISRNRGVGYLRRFDQDAPTVRTLISRRAALPITVELMRRGDYTELNVLIGGVWRRAGRSTSGSGTIGLAIASGRRDVLATARLEDARSDTDSFPAISNLTPNYGQEFVAGTPIPIEWIQREPHPVTLSYSLDNGETWTAIPECTSVMATSCVWNHPFESEAARIRADFDDANDRAAWTATNAFVIRPGSLHPLPSGWMSRDVGGVEVAGFATYTRERRLFAAAGSGAGLSGAADEFHFVSRPVVQKQGRDVEITARVASTELFGPSRAGLMVRAHAGPGAPHVTLLVPTSAFDRTLGLTFVRRRTEGGETIATLGPAVADPAWIRFIVGRYAVYAYYREASNAPWRFLGKARNVLGSQYEAGLVVSSFGDGTLARATFDTVKVRYVRPSTH
jgi:hypothetical protein